MIESNVASSIQTTTQFEQDVIKGLSSTPKRISSKYFYDEKGDQLFQQIMELDEYYLTRAEAEIFQVQSDDIIKSIRLKKMSIIELGAGDGTKTVVFLKKFSPDSIDAYIPVDISPNVLTVNKQLIGKVIPDLAVLPEEGEYFEALERISLIKSHKLVLFLGSNIGNFSKEQAQEFLESLSSQLNHGDHLLIGIDRKKNPKTVLAAYNDKKGVTKQFNLNLLERMNRELGASFDLTTFDHYPTYDPETGTTKSYLVSLKAQTISFDGGFTCHFDEGEILHTEISQKYSLEEIEALGKTANMRKVQTFFDGNKYYTLNLFVKE